MEQGASGSADTASASPSAASLAAAASAANAAASSSSTAAADPTNAVNANANATANTINDRVKEGMLQGFITITTFTNWQKSFRWDSMHESAFAYDDPKLAEAMKHGERKYDRDGTLAQGMQGTVRCGDTWNEGIVWPRIAEISLLGALGCGRALVQLAIERLERSMPSSRKNYDYVVLQATTNSVPFYESLGFVRVGCITDNDNFRHRGGATAAAATEEDSGNSITAGSGSDTDVCGEEKKDGDTPIRNISTADPDADGKPSADEQEASVGPNSEAAKAAEGLPASEIVSSQVETYTTTKNGEKVGEIAKALGVGAWDIIFLNHFTFPNMAPSSKVLKGTELFVPSKKARVDACSNALRNVSDFGGASDATQWYYCADDETPKDIAEKFNVDCKDLVRRNRDRLSGIQPFSNLMEG